ncbi:hypothetical protein [Helicobacter sp. T3_23-1056]
MQIKKKSHKLTNDLLQTILPNIISAKKQTQNNYLLKNPYYKAQSDKKFERLIKAIEILQSKDKKQAKILKYKILECEPYNKPCTKEQQLDIGEPFELEQYELFYSAIDWISVALTNLTLGWDKKKERDFNNAFEYIEGQVSLELGKDSKPYAISLAMYLYVVILWDLSSDESNSDSKPKNAVLARGLKDGKILFDKYGKILSANDYEFLERYFK